MEENGRLSHLRLLQFISRSIKHDVSYPKSENLICFVKEFLCQCVVLVQILTHSYKLGTLPWKYKCFHCQLLINVLILSAKLLIFLDIRKKTRDYFESSLHE